MKNRVILLSALLIVVFAAPRSHAQAQYWTGTFTISDLHLAAGNNMNVRIQGMPTMTYCASATYFAYVDPADTGASAKIAALITAFVAGKAVNLFVQPTDYYSNGSSYCHIIEFDVAP
jgi:hypothetical protein